MPEFNYRDVESRIDFFSKLLTLAFKIGVLVGGTCLLFYCYRLNYFPVGLSLGDGFLFILLATSFGVVYGFFVISLTALGLWLTPIVRPIQRLWFHLRQRFTKKRINEPLRLVVPDVNALIFGLFGILFIGACYQVESAAIWTLPATSFLLAMMFSVHKQSSSKLAEVLQAEGSLLQPASVAFSVLPVNKERLQRVRDISLFAVFILPLLVGGVSGILLDGVMRFSNIKKGSSYVMLRTPHSAFIPPQFQSKKLSPVPDFMAFENVDVVFSGLGSSSMIEFKYRDKIQRLEIPNESILVVPH